MARGWESKSVESQMAESRREEEQLGPLNAEERKVRQRRHGLELSRAHVVEELALTSSPVRRSALESALATLDGELAKLRPRKS
jgi:hypothetical protein